MEPCSIDELDFSKSNGLLPVVAQSVKNGDVLMFAYVNKDAVLKTMQSGFAHYWSRSRGCLWKKGESSGNLQKIESVWVDCDADTLIYRVHQEGPACHTGKETCFFRQLKGGVT